MVETVQPKTILITHKDLDTDLLLDIREQERRLAASVPETKPFSEMTNNLDKGELSNQVESHPILSQSPEMDGAAENKLTSNTITNPVTEINRLEEQKRLQLQRAKKLAQEQGFNPQPFNR